MNVPAARLVFSDDDRAAILSMIDESLRTGSLTLGPRTIELEEGFRARHGAPYAVAVSSGTSALEIILRAIGVEGREVVVPANTFFASAAAVLHAGGTPRFADVAPDTLALSAGTVEAALNDDTAGVMLVHIGGAITPEVDAIRALCERRGLFLVEDAAHAHGASLDGRPAGSFGVASAFSFYPTKVMTTGEGGMIVTADDAIRDDAVVYRDQGKAGFHGGDHVRMGYAWRMSELHAAVGIVQLRRLDEFIKIRREIADQYDEGLAAIDGITPLITRSESNYYKYIAMLDPGIDRQTVKRTLKEHHGVSLSGEVYASPLHEQPVFTDLHHGSLPVAEDVCRRHVCLPIHSDMTRDEAAYVIESIRTVLAGHDVMNGTP
ncbi:MAG TPA: DegT/DnrJ/EryC1/StrS family aminotransferase [Acidimicrobiia bacterium]|nr:DegT/DnrJ/EryC1/StrS family aminotransferase [Acidimicrobiia bacterium]